MIKHNQQHLRELLSELGVSGIEALFCDPWKRQVVPTDLIYGVHLNFWPTWLSLWQDDQAALSRQFGSLAKATECFGGLTKTDFLAGFRQDIQQAKAAGAAYLVFHVSHNEPDELYHWRFRADSRTVIEATIEVINCLTPYISQEMLILFENLWWPGLTLLEPNLVEHLLSKVNHPKVGLMLDTGHLMNTNQALKTEREGIEYVQAVLAKLGSLTQAIKGIHLHQSLSGQYVKQSRSRPATNDPIELMAHIMQIDRHEPFSEPGVIKIIETVDPIYLVHEFITSSRDELIQKTLKQRQALNRQSKT